MTSFCSWVVVFYLFSFFAISAWWRENVKRTQVEWRKAFLQTQMTSFLPSSILSQLFGFFSFLSLFSHLQSLKENKWGTTEGEDRKMTSKIIQPGWRGNTSYPIDSFLFSSQLDSILCFVLPFSFSRDDENDFLMISYDVLFSPSQQQQGKCTEEEETAVSLVSFVLWVTMIVKQGKTNENNHTSWQEGENFCLS